jgi:group I intron endonuclease
MTNEIFNQIWSLYRIVNLINGKVYIGQAADVSKRWHDHRRAVRLNRPTQIIHHAMIKHGLDNFVFEVIACCKTQDDANHIETELVKQYNTYAPNGYGYNATFGGMNAPKTEAWRQQMREHWADPVYKTEVAQAISNSLQSRTPEEKAETAKLLSKIFRGRHLSPTTEFEIGHKLSSESLQKMSNSLSGRECPERKGVPLSQEVRNKISESKMGSTPWNKNTKGIMKPNSGSFTNKINWPSNDELLSLVNQHGITGTAKLLEASPASVSMRVSKLKSR